jgi:hypothetical protein
VAAVDQSLGSAHGLVAPAEAGQAMTGKRNSIRATYDSRETGPRYHVTVRVNGQTIAFRKPVGDPFVRQTVTTTWPGLLRSLLRFRPLVTEIIIGGDSDVIEDVMELDGNYLGSNCTRRDAFHSHINEAIARMVTP